MNLRLPSNTMKLLMQEVARVGMPPQVVILDILNKHLIRQEIINIEDYENEKRTKVLDVLEGVDSSTSCISSQL